jgi:hypothetical protein
MNSLMKIRKIGLLFLIFSLSALIPMYGCGGGGGGGGETSAPSAPSGGVSALTVSGTASEGALITGKTVNFKDANGSVADTISDATTGTYSIDVTVLTAPFLVTITGTNGTYISLAQTAGTANINPITTMVVALAAGTSDVSALFTGITPAQLTTINTNYTAKSALVTASLQTALPAGFTAGSYFTGTVTAGTGMDAIFDTYRITVHPTDGITVKTNDSSATTCLTIPVATVTANTTEPLPTINVPAPSPPDTPHAPVISNAQYSPKTATQNQGNGSVIITGTIDFTDQGGDVNTVTIKKYDSQGVFLNTTSYDIQNTSGVASGTIRILGYISTATVGDFTLVIYVTDADGNISNMLAGTFSVTAVPEATFEIIFVTKTTASFLSPSLMITVKNTGTATGYNVGCNANALNAAGTIVDTATAFFASLENINVGQSAISEAVFFHLNSHADYATLEYDCSWLTRR